MQSTLHFHSRRGGAAGGPVRGRSSSRGPVRVSSNTPDKDTKLPPISVVAGGAAAAVAAGMHLRDLYKT